MEGKWNKGGGRGTKEGGIREGEGGGREWEVKERKGKGKKGRRGGGREGEGGGAGRKKEGGRENTKTIIVHPKSDNKFIVLVLHHIFSRLAVV